MSDQEPTTTRGAIDASRGNEQRTASGTGDPNWSGVSSGAEGVIPQGATVAGSSSGSPDAGSGSGSTQSQVREQADRVISTATQKAGSLAGQATSSMDAGIEKASGGLDTLAGAIRDKSQSLGGAQSMANTAADKIEARAEMLRGQSADQMISELEALVRRRPVESMLVAAGAGFILSKALR
jgi:ElaB/YqjD/DUF883 family membrane-anchored ribosome-binding protein